MVFFTALFRLLVVVACLVVGLFMPNMLVGLAIWPVVWLMWQRVPGEERVSASSLIQLLPFAIAAQGALDSLVPFLGDTSLLVGNAMVVAALRRPKLPAAQIYRVTVASRRARVRRVMASRANPG